MDSIRRQSVDQQSAEAFLNQAQHNLVEAENSFNSLPAEDKRRLFSACRFNEELLLLDHSPEVTISGLSKEHAFLALNNGQFGESKLLDCFTVEQFMFTLDKMLWRDASSTAHDADDESDDDAFEDREENTPDIPGVVYEVFDPYDVYPRGNVGNKRICPANAFELLLSLKDIDADMHVNNLLVAIGAHLVYVFLRPHVSCDVRTIEYKINPSPDALTVHTQQAETSKAFSDSDVVDFLHRMCDVNFGLFRDFFTFVVENDPPNLFWEYERAAQRNPDDRTFFETTTDDESDSVFRRKRLLVTEDDLNFKTDSDVVEVDVSFLG